MKGLDALLLPPARQTPGMADDLTVEQAKQQCLCPHTHRTGGNDYTRCTDCDLEWDYRKTLPSPVAINALIAAVRAETLAEYTLTDSDVDKCLEAAKRRLLDTIHDVEAMPTDDEAWDDPIDRLIAAVRAERDTPTPTEANDERRAFERTMPKYERS